MPVYTMLLKFYVIFMAIYTVVLYVMIHVNKTRSVTPSRILRKFLSLHKGPSFTVFYIHVFYCMDLLVL